MRVSAHDWALITAAREAASARLELMHSLEVTPFLTALEQRGGVAALLDELEVNLRHLAPLVGYVGDELYSAEGFWTNNLMPRSGSDSVLDRLRAAAPGQWSRADRYFVFAIHILLQSGGAYRLEGMNGMQLDPCTIEGYLSHKAQAYAAAMVGATLDDFYQGNMLTKARCVGQLEARLRDQYVLYRVINGTSLNKQLKYFPRSHIDPEQLPSALVDDLGERFGLVVSRATDWRKSLRAVAIRALSEQRLPELLVALVRSGLWASESDFFMTRGPRFLHIPEHYCSLASRDFYCAVLCRPGFEPEDYQLHDYEVGAMRWNQSKRMQFNGWKFWHGSLRDDERQPGQYWFIPPGMPDLAYHEDMVHAGHRKNGVVQSIRAPGALHLRGHQHPEPRRFLGACDTRAARADLRHRYGGDQVVATICHQIWITHILQVAADTAWERGQPLHIDSFDRAFHHDEPLTRTEREACAR
ncbi:MAG: hypothetical protein AAGC55_14845 [Myxococcota bacterium]